MEELLLPKGAVIIQQDDVGDSVSLITDNIHEYLFSLQFYVVQEGQVAVTVIISCIYIGFYNKNNPTAESI